MRVILLLLVLFAASAAARYICFEEGTSIPAEAIYEMEFARKVSAASDYVAYIGFMAMASLLVILVLGSCYFDWKKKLR